MDFHFSLHLQCVFQQLEWGKTKSSYTAIHQIRPHQGLFNIKAIANGAKYTHSRGSVEMWENFSLHHTENLSRMQQRKLSEVPLISKDCNLEELCSHSEKEKELNNRWELKLKNSFLTGQDHCRISKYCLRVLSEICRTSKLKEQQGVCLKDTKCLFPWSVS